MGVQLIVNDITCTIGCWVM